MFGIGMPEMLIILAVALIIIGPKKLPDLAKSLGRALGDFKRATNELKETIEMETGVDEVRGNLNNVKEDLEKSVALADEAPASVSQAERQEKAPEGPLEKVKMAVDELNKPADTQTGPAEDDDDAMGEDFQADQDDAKGDDPSPEDKATP